MPTSDLPPKEYIFCNNCGTDTNHICKADHSRYFDDEGFGEITGYRFWVCAGCERGTLEKYYTNDMLRDDYGEKYERNEYFPPRAILHVKEKTFKQLPKKLDNIYRETLTAYNDGLIVLCAIGIRSLLEGICVDKGIRIKGITPKIKRLSEFLPQNIVTNLLSMGFLGNDAAHELEAPSTYELRLAIEVCEDLLNYLYELDYKTSQLAEMRLDKRKPADPNELPF